MSPKFRWATILVIVCLFALIVFSVPGGAVEKQEAPGGPKQGYANPAAVYCLDQGYEYEQVTTDTGVSGICKFPDETSCDEWDFLSGNCGVEHSFCAQQGLLSETRSDGENPFSEEYAVCVTAEGNEVGTVSSLSDLEAKSIKAVEDLGPVDAQTPEILEDEELGEEVEAAALPAVFDWRSQPKGNYLTSVKNQGQCGSCWAFSAVGVAEAALNIANDRTGNSYDLSEQYLVSDCNGYSTGRQNCEGGWKDRALNYIKNPGIPTEGCMPYVDGNASTGCGLDDDGWCASNCTYRGGPHCSDCVCGNRCENWEVETHTLTKVGKVSSSAKSIKSALVTKGPLAVSLRMNGYFDGDIYRCAVDSPTNHAVDIVGFNDTEKYWIVRNSWGSTWNGDGYFKVGYGECSIEKKVYYGTTLPNGPVTTSPGGTIDYTTPTYRWSSLPDATKYQVRVYRGTSIALDKTVLPGVVCSGAQCSLSPTKPLKASAYTWKVRAYQNKAWTNWSAPRTFIVATDFLSYFEANTKGWKAVNGTWKRVNSAYYSTKGVKNKSSSAYYYPQVYGDAYYEVNMLRDSNGCWTCANRMIIRGKQKPLTKSGNWGYAYYFQYTNSGYFSVWLETPTGSRPIKDWTTSSAINTDGWNMLSVVFRNRYIEYYINGTLVWTGTDYTKPEGYMGVGMYRDNSSTDMFLVDWAGAWPSYLAPGMEGMEAEAELQVTDPSQFTVEGGTIDFCP